MTLITYLSAGPHLGGVQVLCPGLLDLELADPRVQLDQPAGFEGEVGRFAALPLAGRSVAVVADVPLKQDLAEPGLNQPEVSVAESVHNQAPEVVHALVSLIGDALEKLQEVCGVRLLVELRGGKRVPTVLKSIN